MRYHISHGDGALGAAETPPSQLAQLVSQLNRFTTPEAATAGSASYRIATSPFAAGNEVTMPIAIHAVILYQRAAADSYSQFHDRGSLQRLEFANQWFSTPVASVQANMIEVTNVIGALADSLGLPRPSKGGSTGDTKTILLVAAGVGLAVWLFSR